MRLALKNECKKNVFITHKKIRYNYEKQSSVSLCNFYEMTDKLIYTHIIFILLFFSITVT